MQGYYEYLVGICHTEIQKRNSLSGKEIVEVLNEGLNHLENKNLIGIKKFIDNNKGSSNEFHDKPPQNWSSFFSKNDNKGEAEDIVQKFIREKYQEQLKNDMLDVCESFQPLSEKIEKIQEIEPIDALKKLSQESDASHEAFALMANSYLDIIEEAIGQDSNNELKNYSNNNLFGTKADSALSNEGSEVSDKYQNTNIKRNVF